jgi:hypothetical protein
LAACRQRSSTDDRNPVADVIGISSCPTACRKFSSIWVARAAPVETNAAYGEVQPAPADRLGVCRSLRGEAITVIVGVPAQFHVPH